MKTNNLIKNYKTYLRLEQGLSPNSVEAYLKDVSKLERFCESTNIRLEKVSYSTIVEFIQTMAELGISARTQARLISGIKSFYKYLLLDKVIAADPTALVESPKIGRKLPDVLSKSEIERMLAAIDLSKPEGQRNKAIIETLYGCGLRASELINLNLSDI